MTPSDRKQWTKSEIEALDKTQRLHLINSITGIKPANLIATQDNNGQCNLGIFSSIVHLGSQPALLGFILRPSINGNRHTYENIKATGRYSINAVHQNSTDRAHYTSAPFPQQDCEFDLAGFEIQHHAEFSGIFVQDAPIQIGMQFVEALPIEANNTQMIIGSVEFIAINAEGVESDNQLNLQTLGIAGISGLNRYYELALSAQYPQAKVGTFPQAIHSKK